MDKTTEQLMYSLVSVGCIMAFNKGFNDTTVGKFVQILFSLKKPFGCDICMSFWVGCIMAMAFGDIAYLGLIYLFTAVLTKIVWS